MSTTAYNQLIDYLICILTPDDMRKVGEKLIMHSKMMGQTVQPYTMEEINARIDEAERQSAAGLGIDSEEMFRQLEQEFSEEEHIELAEAV